MRPITLAALLALGLAVSTRALSFAQSPSWLDGAPKAWQTPNAAVPHAPPSQNPNPRCGDQERPPAGAEETQVAAAGWKLQTFWPAQRNGGLAVVTAGSAYDGMCRPWAFNVFAFSTGRFAGTLAPTNMDSRTDGVLVDQPQLLSDHEVQAQFTRYAPSDPLCCASRGRTAVTYQLQTGGAPTIAPIRIAPVAMPKAGSGAAVESGIPPYLAAIALFSLAVAVIAATRASRLY